LTWRDNITAGQAVVVIAWCYPLPRDARCYAIVACVRHPKRLPGALPSSPASGDSVGTNIPGCPTQSRFWIVWVFLSHQQRTWVPHLFSASANKRVGTILLPVLWCRASGRYHAHAGPTS